MKHSRVARAKERGFMMVIVVILIVLTIIVSAGALIFWAQKIEAERLQKAYKDRRLKLDNEISRVQRKKAPMGQATGLVEGGTDLAAIKTESANFLAEKQEKLARKRLDEIIAAIEKLQKSDSSEADRFNIEQKKLGLDEPLTTDELREALPLYQSIRSLYPILFLEVEDRRLIRDQLALKKTLWEYRSSQIGEITDECLREKEAVVAELEKEINEIDRKIAESETRAATLLENYAREADEAATKIEIEATEFTEWEMRIGNEIRELERRIAEMKVKERIRKGVTVSFGHLLEPDVPNKRAAIDLGSRDRIKAGMKFLVGRRGKFGEFEYKGEIEVKKVWMTHSEVIINDVYHSDHPLVDGDPIVNPLYNPRRSVVVALTGRENLVGTRFPSMTEVKNRMREMGVDVRENCDLDVDFVVQLQKEEKLEWNSSNYPNYERAILLDMTMLDHQDVFRFLGD